MTSGVFHLRARRPEAFWHFITAVGLEPKPGRLRRQISEQAIAKIRNALATAVAEALLKGVDHWWPKAMNRRSAPPVLMHGLELWGKLSVPIEASPCLKQR
ncbi:hypothetical protein BN77_p11181 [Rhizobium mesoamericanum STM3625]|uniref:Uncharacterized protein n=1 Tax=Rhizobium mesoamericanum STM3625 TaxID=1211777 RepID=K0Q2R2_9HYPH|nr:hypothetical protein BN77_p11181 [Rhizobium mesoamericanum STM3625]